MIPRSHRVTLTMADDGEVISTRRFRSGFMARWYRRLLGQEVSKAGLDGKVTITARDR